MSIVALIESLEADGVDAAAILRAVKCIASAPSPNAYDRKREADRVRIAEKRQVARQSRDNDATPPSSGFQVSPTPPSNLPNHPPPKTPLTGGQKGSPDGEAILIEAGTSPEAIADWKQVRKAKRAGPITQTVAESIIREARKAGLSPDQAVRKAAERGWQSFNADWGGASQSTGPPIRRTPDGRDVIRLALERQNHAATPGLPESPIPDARLLVGPSN